MIKQRELTVSNKTRILLLCGIILLVSCPLLTKGIASGHDMDFHLMRIEGIADELRRGVFPVRMSSSWMDGYGYPISVFYGDILLYMPAMLRVMGLSALTAYKCYILAINCGTVIISYICFGKVFRSETVALLATLAYATSGYRIVCVYVRSAVGEITAMMFLPIIVLAVYKLYTLGADNWQEYKRYALILAFGMTGVLTCHLACTEMVITTLIILSIALWRKTFTKSVLRGYALAAVLTIGLSAYFVVPFLDYMGLYYVGPMLAHSSGTDLISGSGDGIREAWFLGQAHGAYVAQYFAVFQNIFGWSEADLTSRLGLSPGLALMVVLGIALVDWVQGIATRKMKIYLIFSLLMLCMASDLFPWDFLWTNTPILGKVLAVVQFPWRYLTIAIIFMTMLVGSTYMLTDKDKVARRGFCTLIVASCVLMSLFYVSDYCDNSTMRYDYDVEINTYSYMDGQYLRVDRQVPPSFTGETASENISQLEVLSRDGTHMELYCEATETDGTVELPVLNYKGYQVTDENGNAYEIQDGVNNVISITVPAGFAGRLVVDFVAPWYWRIGEAVSLCTVLAVGIILIRRWRLSRAGVLATSI